MKREIETRSRLRRTAGEIRSYRRIMRVAPIALACISLGLILTFIISVLYSRYGSFTVSVRKFQNQEWALSLSQTPDFKDPISRLNCNASKDITNISAADLPDNLNSLYGEHSGRNYLAYTFFCKNTGTKVLDYEYEVQIKNASQGVEQAIRVRVYENLLQAEERSGNGKTETVDVSENAYTDYAWPSKSGSPEPGTVPFLSSVIVCRNNVLQLEPGGMTKFTVVIWLEGDDPECLDDILGGEFKIDMYLSVLTGEEP